MQRDGHRLLTIAQTAAMLDVSRMTVDRAVKAGEIPSIKIRRIYKVPRAFVERLLETAESGESVVVEEYATTWKAS